MSPSSPLSAHTPPTSSQSTLRSFSVPPQPSHIHVPPSKHIHVPPSKTDAPLTPPQPLPPRVSTIPFSPPRSISVFLNSNSKASKSPSLSNLVRSSANKDGFSGQIIIIGILVAAICVAIIVALIICYIKRKNVVPLDSDRLPTPQPNDGLHNAPSPQQLPQILYLPGVHGNPIPWNVIPPTIRLNNSLNSSPNTEVHGTPVLPLCGGDFTIQELSLATRCFSKAKLLDESEFGSVYKGVLPNGRRIAVKWLKMDSRQGKDQPVMNWATRMKISVGSAKGLAYIHEDCNPSIFHLYRKASNILLDSSFEAKISDFGLAKTSCRTKDDDDDDNEDDDMTNVIGAVENSGTSRARPLLTKALETKDFHGLADPRLQEDYNSEEMASMVACASACIRNPYWRRPPMSEIILVLEGNISWSDLSEGTSPVQSSSRGVHACRSQFFNRRR